MLITIRFLTHTGESYGGSYVVSLARSYLLLKEQGDPMVKDIGFKWVN